ncbi:MAG: hypothetical protein RIR18_1253 [Pseudomonadota bacterium]|jgi:hypothetical protein
MMTKSQLSTQYIRRLASSIRQELILYSLVIRELHNELRFCEKGSVHSSNVCVQQDLVNGEPTPMIHPL